MRSKKLILILSFGLIFFSCEKTDESASIIEPSMSVEEVQNFINEINFSGMLASGQKVDFVPNDILRGDPSEPNYTESEQPNFTQDQGLIFNIENLASSGGLLRVFSNTTSDFFDVRFEYVLILTFGELEKLFPNEVNIHPEMRPWVLGIAFGSDKFDVEDLFENEFDIYGVTDFIQILFDPSDSQSFNGLWITEGEDYFPFYLIGNYKYVENRIESDGHVEYNYFSGSVIIGSYDLFLQE